MWTKPGIEWWEEFFLEHTQVLLVLDSDHLLELFFRNISLKDKEQAYLPLTIKTVVSPSSMFLSWMHTESAGFYQEPSHIPHGTQGKRKNTNSMLMLFALL